MGHRVLGLLLLLGSFSESPQSAAQISVADVKSLAVSALAEKVLGQAGNLMVDVQPNVSDGRVDWLRFYSRAEVTGSQFGLCGADWVTVKFEDGVVSSLSVERRFGVEGDTYRAPGAWTYDESDALCRSASSMRHYFPAPDPQSALELAIFIDALTGKGPFQHQSYSFKCSGLCAKAQSLLHTLDVTQIDGVRSIDCPTGRRLKFPTCLEVTVGANRIGPYPQIYRIIGSYYMNRAVIAEVSATISGTVP